VEISQSKTMKTKVPGFFSQALLFLPNNTFYKPFMFFYHLFFCLKIGKTRISLNFIVVKNLIAFNFY